MTTGDPPLIDWSLGSPVPFVPLRSVGTALPPNHDMIPAPAERNHDILVRFWPPEECPHCGKPLSE
jgi:hypothetical protein